MPRSANGSCGICGHHVSMHSYAPDRPRNKGPGACSLGCTCQEYVRPLPALRRQLWLLTSGVRDAFVVEKTTTGQRLKVREGDDTALAREVEALIARVEAHRKQKRREARCCQSK